MNRLTAYTANLSLQHTRTLKRILRYLAGTKTYGITYTALPNKNRETNLFHGYADASLANVEGCKSTSGYVFLEGGGAITWLSKKQSVVALSSTEVEYVALSEAGREACWLRSLYEELGFKQTHPTLIKSDNNGAIAMAKNPQFHKRAKHIKMRWHWIRDLVEGGIMTIRSCRDADQTADIFTKVLG